MHCIVKENLSIDVHYEQIYITVNEAPETGHFMTNSWTSAEDTGVWKQGL